MEKGKSYITLYADEFDRDVWKEYCEACGVWGATSITIYFDEKKDIEFTE